MHIRIIKFQDPISNRFWPYAKRNGLIWYAHTHAQAQTNMPPQLKFFKVGGIKMNKNDVKVQCKYQRISFFRYSMKYQQIKGPVQG